MEEAPIASEVNIPDSPTTLQHSIASEMSESKGRVRTRCAVSTCRRPHHDHTVDDDGQRIILHKFPTNPELVRAWFTRIGNKDGVRTSHSYVCSLHFQPSDYKRDLQNELLGIPSRKRNQLNPDAVPSLLLPNLSPSIEQEIQRAARLKEKCERRIRQEYISKLTYLRMVALLISTKADTGSFLFFNLQNRLRRNSRQRKQKRQRHLWSLCHSSPPPSPSHQVALLRNVNQSPALPLLCHHRNRLCH